MYRAGYKNIRNTNMLCHLAAESIYKRTPDSKYDSFSDQMPVRLSGALYLVHFLAQLCAATQEANFRPEFAL